MEILEGTQLVCKASEEGLGIIDERRQSSRLTTRKSDAVAEFIKGVLGDKEFIFVYPNDSSCTIPVPGIDPKFRSLVGGCLRRKYLERFSIPRTDKEDMSYLRRKQVGEMIETAERQNIMEAGCCSSHNKKFVYIPDRNNNFVISGEIDMIMNERIFGYARASDCPPTLTSLFDVTKSDEIMRNCVLEIKSFYGYDARKNIYGNTRQVGFPKHEHILQTAQYISACLAAAGEGPGHALFLKVEDGKLVRDDEVPRANLGIIYYIDRGACDTREHLIKVDDNRIIVNEVDMCTMGVSFDCVNDNYDMLFDHVHGKRLPPRTSSYMYSEEQVEAMNSAGLISKTKMDRYSKRQLAIGDWQCKYCGYAKFCIGETPWKSDSVPLDNYISMQVDAILKGNKKEGPWQPTIIATFLEENR